MVTIRTIIVPREPLNTVKLHDELVKIITSVSTHGIQKQFSVKTRTVFHQQLTFRVLNSQKLNSVLQYKCNMSLFIIIIRSSKEYCTLVEFLRNQN